MKTRCLSAFIGVHRRPFLIPLPFAESPFNHGDRAFSDLHVLQALRLHPFDAAHVSARAQRAAGDAADVVNQHVVVLGRAASVAHDALEDFEHAQRLDFEAGLFADFAAYGAIQALAQFKRAARQRPPALQRFLAALRHEDASAVEDQRAHADDGALGVAAVVRHWSSCRARKTMARAVRNSVFRSPSPKARLETTSVISAQWTRLPSGLSTAS